MEQLSAAHDGWINLLPGVDEDEDRSGGQPGALGGLFGPPQTPVAMCTWFPRKKGRPAGESTIGIMHPRSRHAIAQLADLGAPLPTGWRVRQDHARRGLIVLAPPSVTNRSVLEWSLAAGALLSMVPLTGMWEARVYQPV